MYNIKKYFENLIKKSEVTPHTEILKQLLAQLEPFDFDALAFPQVEKLRE